MGWAGAWYGPATISALNPVAQIETGSHRMPATKSGGKAESMRKIASGSRTPPTLGQPSTVGAIVAPKPLSKASSAAQSAEASNAAPSVVKFGETTAIVDRCIFESAVKIVWLCSGPSPEKFTRYLADGLKTELEFKAKIESNIAARSDEALGIETRMLTSVRNHMAAAGLTEAQISEAKKLPDLASMLSAIGFDRLIYITAQKIGSHHVHGTWPSLLFHYLEEEPRGSGTFIPRGHDCATHVNQFMFVPLIVLAALSAYVNYVFERTE